MSATLTLVRLGWPSHSTVAVVNVEGHLGTVGQERPANADKGKAKARHQLRRKRQVPVEAGIDHSLYLPGLPSRALNCKRHYGFEGGIHRPLDHLALGRKWPPKLSNALCPTRSLKTLMAPGCFALR